MIRRNASPPIARAHPRRDSCPTGQGQRKWSGLELSRGLRALILLVGAGMSLATGYAAFRGLAGLAPAHPNARELAVIVHVASVIPAVPLGAFLLLAPKGSTLHKRLGKLWVGLMVLTALSAIFIRWDGGLAFGLSPIHLFVPLVLWGSYGLVSAARAGDMETHKRKILRLYLGALTIPGIVAFVWEGRMMNVWLLG